MTAAITQLIFFINQNWHVVKMDVGEGESHIIATIVKKNDFTRQQKFFVTLIPCEEEEKQEVEACK